MAFFLLCLPRRLSALLAATWQGPSGRGIGRGMVFRCVSQPIQIQSGAFSPRVFCLPVECVELCDRHVKQEKRDTLLASMAFFCFRIISLPGAVLAEASTPVCPDWKPYLEAVCMTY